MSNPLHSKRLSALAVVLGYAACAGWAGAATTAVPPTLSATARAGPAGAKQAAPIDINSASRAQLKTLPGIGDVEADRIISGRPYHSKADLVEREVIATGVYLSMKDRIIAKQKPAKVAGSVGVP